MRYRHFIAVIVAGCSSWVFYPLYFDLCRLSVKEAGVFFRSDFAAMSDINGVFSTKDAVTLSDTRSVGAFHT